MWCQTGQALVFVGAGPKALQDAVGQEGSSKDCPSPGPSNSVNQVRASDPLQQIAGRPGHDRGKEGLVIGVGGEHQAGDLGPAGSDLATDLDAAAVGKPYIEDGDVGLVGGMRASASATVPASPTTLMSPAASSNPRRPLRTTSWSSRRNTPSVIFISSHLRSTECASPGADLRALDTQNSLSATRNALVTWGFVPYHSIEDPAKLRRVLEASLLIERDLELPVLLRHVAEEARSMTGARYAALGVLNEDRTVLSEFITVGLEPDEEAKIGQRPTGRGVLGLLIAHPEPLRLSNLSSDPKSFGFPPNHPPMDSFLGVPIKVRDEVYGKSLLDRQDRVVRVHQ